VPSLVDPLEGLGTGSWSLALGAGSITTQHRPLPSIETTDIGFVHLWANNAHAVIPTWLHVRFYVRTRVIQLTYRTTTWLSSGH
jgi:hypothetical protein